MKTKKPRTWKGAGWARPRFQEYDADDPPYIGKAPWAKSCVRVRITMTEILPVPRPSRARKKK